MIFINNNYNQMSNLIKYLGIFIHRTNLHLLFITDNNVTSLYFM